MDIDDDFVNFNLPKRNKTKRKKDGLKYKKTCAIYGIFDCNCCKKDDDIVTNEDYNQVIDETINQPSTSRLSANEDELEQNINDDEIDVGTDCSPLITDEGSSRVETKVSNDVLEYINSVYKEANFVPEPEINILNEINEPVESVESSHAIIDATSAATSEPLPTTETVEDSSIKCEILPVTEEEEEIDVVNIPTDETAQSEHNPAVEENDIKTEFSDDENQIIDIINFDETDCRENLANNLDTNNINTNMDSTSNINTNENEDEIIDVENLVDDSPLENSSDSQPRTHRIRRQIKRRLLPHIIHVKRSRLIHSVMTIDLINTSRDDSIIEITDSPVVPRKITEVINVDDDDDDENDGDSELNVSSTPHCAGLGNCPVCLQSLAKKEIMSTICGHVYCARCIKNVIKTTKKCPNCRKNLTLKSIHPLFI